METLTPEETRIHKGFASLSNKMALSLYEKLRQTPGNVFFSPSSIHGAFAMVYAGARGLTAREMEPFYGGNTPATHRNYTKFNNSLRSYRKNKIEIGNALWGQRGLKFRQSFLNTIAECYGGGFEEVDFENPDAAIVPINNWAAKNTHDLIKRIVEVDNVDGAKLVLTNAIYFKGNWQWQFQTKRTREAEWKAKGQKSSAMLMYQSFDDQPRYMETPEFQAIELPYADRELSMLIFLPRQEDGLPDLERKFSLDNFNRWTGEFEGGREINLYLPRFKAETKYDKMGPMIAGLGMETLFSDSADLSEITDEIPLKVGSVIHKAVGETNEEGSEMAAVTAVTTLECLSISTGPPPVTFRADHPFLYTVVDQKNGAILFMGRCEKP